ncbi:MAG: hypothetical protein HZC02_01660 [Candidatus Levybacteria bacterium]|nr:hypothetical protein [Candidatus Levybacteria bacterium]
MRKIIRFRVAIGLSQRLIRKSFGTSLYRKYLTLLMDVTFCIFIFLFYVFYQSS